MNRMFPRRSLVALAVSLVLVFGSVPAYGASATAAVPTGSIITSNAKIGSLPLNGLTDAEARTAIAAARPPLKAITIKGDGKTVKLTATTVKRAVYVTNVDALLAQAMATTDTAEFELAPQYAVKSSVVAGWTKSLVAKKIDHKPKNAARYVKSKKLLVSAEAPGHYVKPLTTTSRITAAVASQIASPGATPQTVAVALRSVKPKVTRKNIPKAILVVLSKFTVTLYNGTKVEKRYKCATGMRGFATPTGKWKVTRKVKNPSWHNPGSAWGKGMPAVIGPGPSNPLGTRAIYLNASGIRIHGTSKSYSIGHRASHGCMRMRRHDIENLYPRVPVGIAVWIVK